MYVICVCVCIKSASTERKYSELNMFICTYMLSVGKLNFLPDNITAYVSFMTARSKEEH